MAASAGRIPQQRSARIIVDNDFAGEPDVLIALAHQLIAPITLTTLVTSSPLYAYLSTKLRCREARIPVAASQPNLSRGVPSRLFR